MKHKALINHLQLAYSPLCNYDFSILKSDKIIQDILSESKIYIIAQRPVISFENIRCEEGKDYVQFDIRQIGNPAVLNVTLPYFQENIATDRSKAVLLHMGSNDANNDFSQQPINNVHGIKFYSEDEFLIWFSPEKFLQNLWKGYFEAEITGDIREFTKYKVHYVGKATDQDIWKRLTGHASLQEILSLEYPINDGSLPTHEIAILFFKFYDNLTINTYDDDSSVDEMVDSLMGKGMPEQRTIFLDAEKALIKAMQPKYNKEVYSNYPKSKDGLYNHKLNVNTYMIMDEITLQYDEGEIEGCYNYMGGDAIVVEENKALKIIKQSASPATSPSTDESH